MAQLAPGKQIVVGVDGSAASAAAVRWAVREARLRRATVRLVCAYHRDARLCAPYAPWSGVRRDERYVAARALLDRSAGAEMLVLGTSRPAVRAGQPPLAMGPVARVCLRRAHCPVVVVAPDDPVGEPGARADRDLGNDRRATFGSISADVRTA